MDAAGEASWQNAMAAHGKLVREQQQHLGELDAKMNMLTNAISSTSVSYRALAAHPSSLISYPDTFSGETSQCKGFLLQCSLYFSGQEGVSEQQKIALFCSLSIGKIFNWASRRRTSYKHYGKLFQRLFLHTLEGTEIGEQLLMAMEEKRNKAK